MAAMTAWVISKKQGFYNGLTEERRRWREADAVFYIAERWKIICLCGIIGDTKKSKLKEMR